MTVSFLDNEDGTTTRIKTDGVRTIMETICDKQEVSEKPILKPRVKKPSGPGTIMSSGRLRLNDGTSVYVGKQGLNHPRALEAKQKGLW